MFRANFRGFPNSFRFLEEVDFEDWDLVSQESFAVFDGISALLDFEEVWGAIVVLEIIGIGFWEAELVKAAVEPFVIDFAKEVLDGGCGAEGPL